MKNIMALTVILLGGVFIAGADSWQLWLIWAVAGALILALGVEALAERWRK
jgi:uncharacterized membrane protein